MTSDYPYATGDRLEKRNTYAYSTYQGPQFLTAWRDSRRAVLETLPAPAEDASPLASGAPAQARTVAALRTALAAGQPCIELDRLVQHFEVSKRIFPEYGEDWRPLDRDDYRDLSLYVEFAELLAAAFVARGTLTYVNALLKCLDTLVALRERLDERDRAALARLIGLEQEFVAQLEAGR